MVTLVRPGVSGALCTRKGERVDLIDSLGVGSALLEDVYISLSE